MNFFVVLKRQVTMAFKWSKEPTYINFVLISNFRSDSKSLSDVFTHLTNYSINKNSSSYCPNEDSEVRQGHKWTLSSLWQHFSEQGIDNKPVIESIKDLVIKTIISAENSMHNLYRYFPILARVYSKITNMRSLIGDLGKFEIVRFFENVF